MGRVARQDSILHKKGKEFADCCELANPGDPRHTSCCQVLHKAFDISAAQACRDIEVHPVLLNPTQKLVEIVSVGAQGFGRIVLSLKRSEKQLKALCGGHLYHRSMIAPSPSLANP